MITMIASLLAVDLHAANAPAELTLRNFGATGRTTWTSRLDLRSRSSCRLDGKALPRAACDELLRLAAEIAGPEAARPGGRLEPREALRRCASDHDGCYELTAGKRAEVVPLRAPEDCALGTAGIGDCRKNDLTVQERILLKFLELRNGD